MINYSCTQTLQNTLHKFDENEYVLIRLIQTLKLSPRSTTYTSTCLLIYLPIYQGTYQRVYVHTYLRTCLPVYQGTYLPTSCCEFFSVESDLGIRFQDAMQRRN